MIRAIHGWLSEHIHAPSSLDKLLLFIPFGYLIPMVWPQKKWTWWKIMLLGFAASFCIEIIQFITRLGFADVDDLMNNTVGAGIGYLLYGKSLTHVAND